MLVPLVRESDKSVCLPSLFVCTFVLADYNIPKWFLNKQKDPKDGGYGQLISNQWDTKLRDDLERLKKMR